MGQPQLNNTNSPNLNVGLGVAANDNLTSSPANENVIKQNTIGNQLAAQRAADFSANRRQLNNDDDTFNESPDDGPIPDGDLYQAPPKKKRSPQFFSGLRQQTANPAAQQQIAGALSSQRRAQMRTLAQQEQNLDSETEDLIKQLNNFRDSGSKKILSFFRPGLTTTIDRLVGHLKERTGSLAFRKQIAFLKGALITLQTLILTLQAFKFIACFLDAAFLSKISALQMIIKLAPTIIGAIIMILLSFIYVPFLSLLFFINKFPLLRGDITKETVEMIKKLKDQKQRWEAKLKKLQEIVSRQDQRDVIRQQEQNLQQQEQAQRPV